MLAPEPLFGGGINQSSILRNITFEDATFE